MRTVSLPADRRLVYYLAAEEYLSEHVSEGDFCADGEGCFFLWQSRPTVIFGRHQVMADEVNIPYCREHHIEMYRRKSGGGCVYSDEGNLMLSYVSRSPHSQEVFATFLRSMVEALDRMGYPAVTTTHNDVLIDGRKVSGSACFTSGGGTIVHGTLLLSSNVEVLRQAITPSAEKLSHNGVQSVRQRVVTLSELAADGAGPAVDIEAVKAALIDRFCGDSKPLQLLPEQLSEIESIEQSYLDPDFISGTKI